MSAEEESYDPTIFGKIFNKSRENAKVERSDHRNRDIMLDILGRSTLPETEEDLVSVYFHMVGRGLLTRYNWLRLNDITVYDGICFAPDLPIARESDITMLTVEFKPTLCALCESDEAPKQRFEDINLSVVWEADANTELPPNYNVVNKESDTSFTDYLPDVNYRVKHGHYFVQVIALKDIFEKLLDERKSGFDEM